ncbi:hypothetical protein [Aeribacillus alveayuensis]|uniref:Phage protein n=1 Tax=Aeribacillus alveayuensis TaxID=279215 RepID=A0ABT9VP37_9BACI|nr:hypothetical protein [Bacillus alveayuensis]
MAKFKVIFQYDNPIRKQLEQLKPGTEVNVETTDNIYYEASFEEYDEETKEATLQVDRFYPEGGKDLTISSHEIISLDTPESKTKMEEDE